MSPILNSVKVVLLKGPEVLPIVICDSVEELTVGGGRLLPTNPRPSDSPAPTPTTLDEALVMIEALRRRLAKERSSNRGLRRELTKLRVP